MIGFTGLATSCSASEERNMNQKTMLIAPNTQIEYEDLRLGIGYLGEEPSQNEMMVQLWPFLRYEEKGRSPIEAHEGDVVEIDHYQLEILEIKLDSVKIVFSTISQ
jgi:hypothetical protein